MASLARASHFSSRRSCSSISVAKNFVLLRGGCPSGFNKPAATSTGISCVSKPRNQAVWVALRRAGAIFQLRNSVCCAISFIPRLQLSRIKQRQVYQIHGTTDEPPLETREVSKSESSGLLLAFDGRLLQA